MGGAKQTYVPVRDATCFTQVIFFSLFIRSHWHHNTFRLSEFSLLCSLQQHRSTAGNSSASSVSTPANEGPLSQAMLVSPASFNISFITCDCVKAAAFDSDDKETRCPCPGFKTEPRGTKTED